MANLILKKTITPDGTEMFCYTKNQFKAHRDTILKQGVFILGGELQNANDFPNVTGFTFTEILDTTPNFKDYFYVGNFADFVNQKFKEVSLTDMPTEDLQLLVDKKAQIFNIDEWALDIIKAELASRS